MEFIWITSLIGWMKSEYCFTSLSAQSWQYRNRRKPEAGTMPYSYFEWLQGLFIVHSTICSTAHSMPLNSSEHCICTTTMTGFEPGTSRFQAPVDKNEPSRKTISRIFWFLMVHWWSVVGLYRMILSNQLYWPFKTVGADWETTSLLGNFWR